MPAEHDLALAQAAFDDGRYQEALALVTPLIGIDPGWRSIALLGETFARLDMAAEAAEVFEHAARRDGADAIEMMRRAARLYLTAGRKDKAMALAATLRRADPTDAVAASIFASLAPVAAAPAAKPETIDDLVASDEPEKLSRAARMIGSDIRDIRNLTVFTKLRRLKPDDPYIRATLIGFAREFCAYDILQSEEAALQREMAAGDFGFLGAETPLYNLMWCGDEALNRLACNVSGLEPPAPGAGAKRRAMPHAWDDRIRIGYLSSDFWDDHATMRLLQSALMAHDPERFEITLFCYTPARFVGFDRGGRQNWGRIVRIEALDDRQAAETIRAAGIDILVDLKGHSGGSRASLMNLPLAPVHVAWLGFPSSAVNIDCDYVIGDRIVLPETSQPHYHENICRLPECYQPNDPLLRGLPDAMSRAEAGLPENRFVFSSFNSQRKNSLETMAIWARVMRACPDALLWLMVDGEAAREATREHLVGLGVRSEQIVFAAKMAYERHLARAQAADLCLDTFPCNGHTTTSDMLWAGVPVVTKRGTNLASRVSESLLSAIGLADLVANDSDGFVALCAALAAHPERVSELKQRLRQNRFTTPLFDATRFCRHLELAYEEMAKRARAGRAPEPFDVTALPA